MNEADPTSIVDDIDTDFDQNSISTTTRSSNISADEKYSFDSDFSNCENEDCSSSKNIGNISCDKEVSCSSNNPNSPPSVNKTSLYPTVGISSRSSDPKEFMTLCTNNYNILMKERDMTVRAQTVINQQQRSPLSLANLLAVSNILTPIEGNDHGESHDDSHDDSHSEGYIEEEVESSIPEEIVIRTSLTSTCNQKNHHNVLGGHRKIINLSNGGGSQIHTKNKIEEKKDKCQTRISGRRGKPVFKEGQYCKLDQNKVSRNIQINSSSSRKNGPNNARNKPLVDTSSISSRKKRKKFSKKAMEKLSKPKTFSNISIQYAKLSDEENCTFHPKLSSQSRRLSKSSQTLNSDSPERKPFKPNTRSFICRMEQRERDRQARFQRERDLFLYQTTVNKKRCPKCFQEQSFEEFLENINLCTNENCQSFKIPYGNTATFQWNRFVNRMEKSREKKLGTLQKIVENERNHEILISKSKRQLQLRRSIEKQRGESFLERMSKDALDKKQKDAFRKEETRIMEEKVCTFQPELHIPPKFLKSRTHSLIERTVESVAEKVARDTKRKKKEKNLLMKQRRQILHGKRKKTYNLSRSTTSKSEMVYLEKGNKSHRRKKTTDKEKRKRAKDMTGFSQKGLAAKFKQLLL